VSRMTLGSALIAAALGMSSSVQAQQPPSRPSPQQQAQEPPQQPVRPEESLNAATQLLGTMNGLQGAGAQQIASLKTDFTDFASTYLAGPASPGTATPGAVGTSGRADVRGDWRTRFQRVEADIAALLGPAGGGTPPPIAAQLDPDTRTRLERVRAQLQTFYAATLGQAGGNPIAHTGTPQTRNADSPAATAPTPPTAEAPQTVPQPAAPGVAPPTAASAARATSGATAPQPRTSAPEVDSQWGSALALLDRMQRILDDAIKEPGKVSLDRAGIDEMRAELAQIRTMLRNRN
jgi:hypothetical protein